MVFYNKFRALLIIIISLPSPSFIIEVSYHDPGLFRQLANSETSIFLRSKHHRQVCRIVELRDDMLGPISFDKSLVVLGNEPLQFYWDKFLALFIFYKYISYKI